MDQKLGAARWVLGLAAVTLAVAAPVAAQDSTAPAATTAPPASNTDIGPGELSNFSLNGTVTRPADRPAATVQPAAPTIAAPGPATTAATRAPAAAAPRAGAAPAPTATSADLFRRPPTLPDAAATSAVGGAIATPDLGPATPPPPLADGFSPLPWIVALLVAGAAAMLYFGRQRRSRSYAGAGQRDIDVAPRQAPPAARTGVSPRAQPQPTPQPAPRPDPIPSPGGRKPLPTTLLPPKPAASEPVVPGLIMSTGLRPWIDVELEPDRALLDEDGVAIAFNVTLVNSGSAAARDVSIEANLINAGHQQDAELTAFFAAEKKPGDSIPQIAPFGRIPLRSAVKLPRSAVREYVVDGRKLFMPMVAINVRYRWSSGDGQSAAGFLVGQGAEGREKLTPLRLDRGARAWKKLGARRYEKGLRR